MRTIAECGPLDLAGALARVRTEAPLVHNITNYVVMNTTANALLAVGASPAMVHALEEAEEFVALAGALVVNVGTLSAPWVGAMHRAAAGARARGTPWVLDPVGVGATTFRTSTCTALLAHRPAVVRANASEVLALAGAAAVAGKGVDSAHDVGDAVEPARRLARRTGAVVAVTGAVDHVTDGTRTIAVANGHPLMTRVTGLGCTASALVGAFVAVGTDPLVATVAALAVLGVAGEVAAERAEGPGTLQLHLLDALHSMDERTLAARARVRIAA